MNCGGSTDRGFAGFAVAFWVSMSYTSYPLSRPVYLPSIHLLGPFPYLRECRPEAFVREVAFQGPPPKDGYDLCETFPTSVSSKTLG